MRLFRRNQQRIPAWSLVITTAVSALFAHQAGLALGSTAFFFPLLGGMIGLVLFVFFWFEEIKGGFLSRQSLIPVLGLLAGALLSMILPRDLLPLSDPRGLTKYLLGGGWVLFLTGTLFLKSFSILKVQASLKPQRLFILLLVFFIMLGFWVGVTPLAGDEGPHISWAIAFAENLEVNLNAITAGEFSGWSETRLSDPPVPGLMNEAVGARRSKWLSLMDPLNAPLAAIALRNATSEYELRRILAFSSILLFALGMTILHQALTRMGLSSRRSGMILLLLTASCSIQLWGNAVLPEAWGFCLTAGLVFLLAGDSPGRTGRDLLGALLLSIYPWLHIRYLPVMGAVLLIWFWFERRRLCRPSLWLVGLLPALSTFGRFAFNAWLTGQAEGAYGADASGAYVSLLRAPLQYAGYWLDADYGLLVNMPLLFVGAGTLYAFFFVKKGGPAAAKKILPFLAGFLIQGLLLSPYNLWHGDGGFGRFILVSLPLLLPIFVLTAGQDEKQFARWCFWGALPGFFLNIIYSSMILVFRMTPHDPLRLGYLLPQTVMWQAYSPEIIFSHWGNAARGTIIVLLQTAVWGAVALGMIRFLGRRFKSSGEALSAEGVDHIQTEGFVGRNESRNS